jgi:flagellar biosynthesis/type III secretory pathway M-ring protein FliF/YscJ
MENGFWQTDNLSLGKQAMTDQSKPQKPEENPKAPSLAAVAAAKKLATMQDEQLKQAMEKLASENPELMAEIIKIWLGQE